MKKLALVAFALALPVFLSACGNATKSNVNVTTIDLTNTAGTNVPATNTVAGNTNTANTNSVVNTNTAAKSVTKEVSITANGFSPSALTVAAGTSVTWTNTSGEDVRVSSDPHPTHTDLPGLDSATLQNGETYSFTFTQVGEWGYHDHFSPTTRGTITVQ